jgi:peptidoglycan/LPS O-acetylase OafA/YrhL
MLSMIGLRLRLGVISGLMGLLPILIIAIITWLIALDSATGTLIAFGGLLLSLIIGGGLSGYLAGQRRRKRKEPKAIVGAHAGLGAALTVGVTIEGLFLYRYYSTPANIRALVVTSHPLRVSFAILLIASLVVVIAMLTAQFTARPLPPPGRTREMRAIRSPQRQADLPIAHR